MGREVGGGFRIGNTCTPVADACWCMAKPIQYCKVKKKTKTKNKKNIALTRWTFVGRVLSLLFNMLSRLVIAFFFSFFYFTILYWFCHTSTCIHHGCTCVPHPEPPSHLSPHTIPLGHTSAPTPSILYPASTLDWRVVSYMILYMF